MKQPISDSALSLEGCMRVTSVGNSGGAEGGTNEIERLARAGWWLSLTNTTRQTSAGRIFQQHPVPSTAM